MYRYIATEFSTLQRICKLQGHFETFRQKLYAKSNASMQNSLTTSQACVAGNITQTLTLRAAYMEAPGWPA